VLQLCSPDGDRVVRVNAALAAVYFAVQHKEHGKANRAKSHVFVVEEFNPSVAKIPGSHRKKDKHLSK
jgi:hypothetical protein